MPAEPLFLPAVYLFLSDEESCLGDEYLNKIAEKPFLSAGKPFLSTEKPCLSAGALTERLKKATPAELAEIELLPFSLHWPLIDEDLSIESLLELGYGD